MNQKKKKILAILLIIIVLLLGVAAIFVTLQLQKAPVPTAPTSIPQAAEWFGGGACNVSFTIPTAGVMTCTSKEIYRDKTGNTPGNYQIVADTLLGANEELVPGEQYVYVMNYSNSGGTTINGVVTDTLDPNLTFVDSGTRGSYDSTARKVTFNINNLAAGATDRSAFRVKVNANATGTITNSAAVTGGNTCSVSNPLATSSVTCSEKETFANESSNTAGNYTYTTRISTVAQNDTFVYRLTIKNTGNAPAPSKVIYDPLTGDHQDTLTFLDATAGCEYVSASKNVKCTTGTIAPNSQVVFGFRVKVSAAAANGQVIKNVATVGLEDQAPSCAKDVTVSGVVSCNNTCTTDAECGSGLVCSNGTCRNSSCTEQQNCVCPTPTPTPTATETPAPTTVAPTTVAPTTVVTTTVAPTTVVTTTVAPTTVVTTVTATPTATGLPKAGVLNLPGAAAFGGGLLLTILGILFAL